MAKDRSSSWKKGRGTLGPLEPLLGAWEASADSPMGPVECRRTFSRILDRTCVLLQAEWRLPGGKRYEELAVFAADPGAGIAFWSFTSDGKRSQGRLADATDVHADAIGFEAEMPAGLARMVYWPADDGGMRWAVESRTKKGWNRFTEHRYRRAGAAPAARR